MLSLKSLMLYLTTWVLSTLLVLIFVSKNVNHNLQSLAIGPWPSEDNASQGNSQSGKLIISYREAESTLQGQEQFNTLDLAFTRPAQEDATWSNNIIESALPVQFLMRHTSAKRISEKCAILPELFHVKMNNVYWQHGQLNGGKNNIYIYAAYYDTRTAEVNAAKRFKGAVVQLLAMTDVPFKSQPKSLCQFWFDDRKTPMFSSQATFHYIWNITWGYDTDNFLFPVLVSCPMTYPSRKAPSVVSFVEHYCDNASTALRVQHSELFNKPIEKQHQETKPLDFGSIAVCVKGLTFLYEDKSVRLIEWLELLKLLGVQQVFFYDLALNPKTLSTLLHYQKSGFVDVRPLTLPGDQVNTPELINLYFIKNIVSKRLNELIPYNDCLYRNLYRFDYIALMDIDEIILPKSRDILTWKEMLQTVAENIQNTESSNSISNISKYSAICARNVYFFDNFTSEPSNEIPSYFHMLNHVKRAFNYTKPGKFVKCFHSVNHALILHNHYPLRCLSKCRLKLINESIAHMQHYRDGCTIDLKTQCQDYLANSISDKTIWKYSKKLIKNVNGALRELRYLNG